MATRTTEASRMISRIHEDDIREAWPREDFVIASTAAWINSAKPGSSEKRSRLMFKAGALYESASINAHENATMYITALEKEIAKT